MFPITPITDASRPFRADYYDNVGGHAVDAEVGAVALVEGNYFVRPPPSCPPPSPGTHGGAIEQSDDPVTDRRRFRRERVLPADSGGRRDVQGVARARVPRELARRLRHGREPRHRERALLAQVPCVALPLFCVVDIGGVADARVSCMQRPA